MHCNILYKKKYKVLKNSKYMNIAKDIMFQIGGDAKEDIINLAVKLNIKLKDTHSCYVSNNHCGTCLACMLRKAGFYWANQKDVTHYKD